jgi:hypothetical protein
MLENLLILFTCSMLFLSARLTGYIPFPTGLIFILCMSQIFFALAHEGLINYNMHKIFNYGGLQERYTFTQTAYSLTALMSLLMLTGKWADLKAVKLDRRKIVSISNTGTVKRSVNFTAALIASHLLLFFVVVDWHKLWSHRMYSETMVDYDVVNVIGVGASFTIMRVTPLWAILSVLCVCLLSGSRSVFLKCAAWLMSSCYFLILLSDDSRTAALVPGLIAIYYAVLRLKGRAVVVPVMCVFAALAIGSALNGRGAPTHGISTGPLKVVGLFQQGAAQGLLQGVLDFCQGAFVTAESLQIRGDFPERYKLLAFSPLPSVIDGYSSIVAASEHRLHVYVPMSGIGEAINFGWPFVGLLIAIITLITRTHIKLARTHPVVLLLCNFLIMTSIYVLFSYPLRNGLRYAWLALFISLLPTLRQKWRPQVKQPELSGVSSSVDTHSATAGRNSQ